MRLLLTTLAPCMLSMASRAQGQVRTPNFDDQYHKSWTVREGVPAALVQAKQTTDGFLWLSSGDGLYRFDGVAFAKYVPPEGQKLLKEGPVAALAATPDGGLWLSYRFGGASLIRKGTVTNFPSNQDFSEAVFAFAQSWDGSFWGASATGLYRFDGTRWSRLDSSWGPPPSEVTHLRRMVTGDLWFDDGINYYVLPQGEKHFHKTRLPAGKLELTGSDIGWLGLDNLGLFPVSRAADGSWSLGKLLLKATISFITHTSDGALWFGAHDGIWRVRNINAHAATSLTSDEIQSMRKADGLTADWVYGITMDREGSVWALTPNGLDQFRKTTLAAVPLPQDMQQPAIVNEGNGSVLVSSSFLTKTLLARVTPKGVKLIPTPQLTTGIHQIYRDDRGVEWVSADGKLYQLHGTTLTQVMGPADLPDDGLKFRAITRDHSGTLWMAIPAHGADRILRLSNGKWDQFRDFDNMPSLTVTSMLTDHSGQIWVGTASSRVFIISDGKIVGFDRKQGVDSGGTTLLQENGDHVWVGGTENLDYYTQGHFRTVTSEGGSPVRGVTGIAETADGDLWINGSRGVLHILAADLQQAVKQSHVRLPTTTLNYLDGAFEAPVAHMQSSTVAQSDDGRIYFAGRQGVTWVAPTDLTMNTTVPGVFVTSAIIDDRSHNAPLSLSIQKGAQNFQINYTATSLSIPERVNFRYKLEGFDQEWQDVGTRRQAYYTHLPPGRYSFLVRASNNDALWSTTPARLDFYLAPTFLQSIWFKLSCVFALLAVLLSFYLLRMRLVTARLRARLFERLAERERIARDLHDTFFQGIQGLLLRINTGTAMLSANEPARRILLDALERSDRVMAEGRELVLDLRADEALTADLAEDLSRVDPRSFGVEAPAYTVVAVGQARRLHPVSSSELLRIGLEAVHNAIKHANAKAVEVEILYERDFLKMRIRDDGQGIDEVVIRDGRRPGHLGLVGMNERADRIGARYSLWSKRGQGTEVEVEVPAKIAYATRGGHKR